MTYNHGSASAASRPTCPLVGRLHFRMPAVAPTCPGAEQPTGPLRCLPWKATSPRPAQSSVAFAALRHCISEASPRTESRGPFGLQPSPCPEHCEIARIHPPGWHSRLQQVVGQIFIKKSVSSVVLRHATVIRWLWQSDSENYRHSPVGSGNLNRQKVLSQQPNMSSQVYLSLSQPARPSV